MPDAHSVGGRDSRSTCPDLTRKAAPGDEAPAGDLEWACAVTRGSSIDERGAGWRGSHAPDSQASSCEMLQGESWTRRGASGPEQPGWTAWCWRRNPCRVVPARLPPAALPKSWLPGPGSQQRVRATHGLRWGLRTTILPGKRRRGTRPTARTEERRQGWGG